MARRTKEELLAELDRLWNVFLATEHVNRLLDGERGEEYELVVGGSPRGFDIEVEKKTGRTRTPVSYHKRIHKGILSDIENGKETLSEAIGGVGAAVNDTLEDLYHDDLGERQRFLDLYEEHTGRSFYEDAGRPGQAAKDILKRGLVADEDEWRILNGIISDVDQTLLTQRQTQKAIHLMDAFELTQGSEEK